MSDVKGLRRREMAVAVCFVLALSACSGGGGSKPTTVTTPPVSPPVTPPVTPPPPPQPPIDAQLALTDTYAAHAAGFNGAGVVIGIIDTGVSRNHPALAGRVTANLNYVDATTNNLAVDDVVGHGTAVAEIAAGVAFDKFAGGIAPGSTIVSARIINDKAPTDDGSGNGNRVTSADPLGQINDDLIAHNVKVSNNSWGGLYWDATDTATTASFHDAYNRFINTWGGLVVFAAGNDSKTDPSDVAELPTRAPDLKNGWLAVVALDSNNPTALASYSNQCGAAMTFCLAAPGDVIVSGQNDTATNTSYFIYQGTSLAAPQVSGAAAVVWQAFPYFSNANVQQTLLGTATDLGAAGPDPVFGYGALDVGKAIRGPAKFDWGNFTVQMGGNTSSTWSNDISGAGGLEFTGGSGVLTLTGNNTYQGLTHLATGNVIAVNPIPGSATVDLQGHLQLGQNGVSGGVKGTLNNNGTVAIQNNATINGDYFQGSTAILSQYAGAVLQIDGTAHLNGWLSLDGATPGYVGTTHQQLITATGGIVGTFITLTHGPNVMITTQLQYTGNEVFLDTSRINVTQVQGMSGTPVTLGSARRLEGAFSQIDKTLATPAIAGTISDQTLLGAAMIQQSASVAAAQQSVASLSGQLHAASAAMTFDAIDAGSRALSDRIDKVSDTRKVGAWTQSLGYSGGMSRSGYGNVGVDISGWMVGQDQRIGSNGIVGFAVSQSEGLGQLAEAVDQGRSRAVEAMAYGGVIGNQWYAMGRFGAGRYRETMRRGLQLGDVGTAVGSTTDGQYGVAYGETGMRLHAGGFGLTPYASVEYAQVDNGGFSEQGAAGFGLTAADQRISRWQAGLGLRATRAWVMPSGQSFSLQGHVQWQHSFATRGDVFSARFTGIDQWGPVDGIGLSRYGGLVGAALDWSMNTRSSLQFSLDQLYGERENSQMAMATYRLQF